MFCTNPRIVIGVWATNHRQRLRESILAIHETAGCAFDLVVLDDLQDTPPSVDGGGDAAIIRVPKPGGGAASLNRLLAFDADLYVMVEAGAIPAPYWLDRMIAALRANPAIGAVGPSTNACWNAQAAIACPRPTLAALGACAAGLYDRFGDRVVAMAPTHNLADFAFAVTRPMVEAVGLADERYQDGPCWEMDYWARGALVGWETAWVQAAFVWRNTVPGAGSGSGAAALDASKRLYQDRFCTLRKASAPTGMATCDHCYGSACSAFTREPIAPCSVSETHLASAMHPSKVDCPLISCVMPTRGRSAFVAQAIHYFQRQDYPNRELVIVYETPDDLPDIGDDPNIKLIRTSETSIGGKREIGSRASTGAILVHWDDDDWYASNRLSRQSAPILANVSDIVGLTGTLFFELAEQTFWDVTPELFGKLFVESVQGGTLMFRRTVWEKGGPYPGVSMREDVAILIKGMKQGARLARLSGRDLCVYLRHGSNSWVFAEGEYLEQAAWSIVPTLPSMQPDLGFYTQGKILAAVRTEQPSQSGSAMPVSDKLAAEARPAIPKVSCIMPTSNRHQFVPNAIAQFLNQDYERRELIILDDGADPVRQLVPDHPLIRYCRAEARQTLGDKRNSACALANGDLIAHWDDDDWIAPSWLSSQVACLQADNADITGIDRPLFHDPASGMIWRYIYDGVKPWVAGGSLLYRRAFWSRNRFASISIGEDNLFLWSPQDKRLKVNPQADLYLARIHPDNTSRKQTTGARWKRVMGSEISQAIDESILRALTVRQSEMS